MFKRKLRQDEDVYAREYASGADAFGEGIDDYDETSSSEDDSVEGEDAPTADLEETTDAPAPGAGGKIKVMILASRGINARQRHLMDDLVTLMPHAKKESKFDSKKELFGLNELAELNGCSHVMFLEARRPQELFIWAARSPSGPSVRFHVQNIHTLEELHLVGNCMKNTRPIVTFDPAFYTTSHGQQIQELLQSLFSTPRNHRKTRPFIDRVMHFAWTDDRVWVRNYQIKEGFAGEPSVDGLGVEEIGPRFVLHPVRIFEGSFRGQTVWKNPNYVSPGTMRASLRANEAMRHRERAKSQAVSALRKRSAVLPKSDLDGVFD